MRASLLRIRRASVERQIQPWSHQINGIRLLWPIVAYCWPLYQIHYRSSLVHGDGLLDVTLAAATGLSSAAVQSLAPGK